MTLFKEIHLQTLILAIFLAISTFASASHVHELDHDHHELNYEDCSAFHVASVDQAICPQGSRRVVRNLDTYVNARYRQIDYVSDAYRPSPRAPPFSL